MSVNVLFSREAILNKNGLTHMQVEINPPKAEVKENSKPVLMVIVLDRSGSMGMSADSRPVVAGESATKMDYAINSTIKFTGLLTDKDMIGVVSFDDMAVIEQKLVNVTEANKKEIIRNVRNIQPRGCTNISDALITAKKMITKEHLDNYNCKIILLSDGEANRGVCDIDGLSSIALDCLKNGITVTSLGIGLQYNSKIMDTIATSGGGLFYHIEDLSLLNNIFEEELKLSNTITAKGVKLFIKVSEPLEIGENMNEYAQEVKDDEIEIYIGDIHNQRRVLFEIKNDFVEDEKDCTFEVRVCYTNREGTQIIETVEKKIRVVQSEEELKKYEENEEVVKRVAILLQNATIIYTSHLYEKGDFHGLTHALSNANSKLETLSHSYSCASGCLQATMDDLKVVASNYTTQSYSASDVKTMYARSRSATRE